MRATSPGAASHGTPSKAAVDLYWIPLGAGRHSVRFNGRVFEAIEAARQHRQRRDLYQSALIVELGGDRYTIEIAPSPDADEGGRGVAATGPVGSRFLGWWRLFRYEVRCWRGGSIPDLAEALGAPRRLTTDPLVARRVLDLVKTVPTPIWGRDELRAGEMWNSNSVIAWLIASAGLPTDRLAPPPQGRAPAGSQVSRWLGDPAPRIAHTPRLGERPRPARVRERMGAPAQSEQGARKILIGYDGSAHAERSIDEAARMSTRRRRARQSSRSRGEIGGGPRRDWRGAGDPAGRRGARRHERGRGLPRAFGVSVGAPRQCLQRRRPTLREAGGRRAWADRESRDNTVTTNVLSRRSGSSMIAEAMGVAATVGKDGQPLRKVEGLVVRLDRGSSNLPGRIKGPAYVGVLLVLYDRLRISRTLMGTLRVFPSRANLEQLGCSEGDRPPGAKLKTSGRIRHARSLARDHEATPELRRSPG